MGANPEVTRKRTGMLHRPRAGIPWVVAESGLPCPADLEEIICGSLDSLGSPPLLTASARGDRVELRVVDRGPGVPEHDRERMFLPFERLGERGGTTSVGLGLAVSRGLTEAMHGTLRPEQTPGGGLTMIISMPAAGHGAG